LTLLAVLYVGYVFVVTGAGRLGVGVPTPHDVGASVDAIEDGKVPRLLSSGLVVDGSLPLLQVTVLAIVVAAVIAREGAVRWWPAAIAGHVGSALLAYLAIVIADGLGSGSAEQTSAQLDYGISAVLAASVGALLVSGIAGMQGRRARTATRADRWITTACALSLTIWIPLSIGWYAAEHLIAFALGCGAMALIYRRSPTQTGRSAATRSLHDG
jgi:hypothetical protein